VPAKRLETICRFGRKSTIDDRLLERLRGALLAGAKRQGFPADVWTLPRVRNLIVKLGGPSFSTVHVWRLLGRMGFSPQRPTGRARERNEDATAAWVVSVKFRTFADRQRRRKVLMFGLG